MRVALYGCDYGFSSDTYDFWYVTVVQWKWGERQIPGGRLAFFILGLFMPKKDKDFGYGYAAMRRMAWRLER